MGGEKSNESLVEKCFLSHIIADPGLSGAAIVADVTSGNFNDQNLGNLWESIKSILPCSDEELILRLHSTYPEAIQLTISILNDRFYASFDSCLQVIGGQAQKKSILADFGSLYSQLVANHTKMSFEDIMTRIIAVTEKHTNSDKAKTTKAYNEVLDGTITTIETRKMNYESGHKPGVTTGIFELDEMIYGWMPGGYYVIAARTSMGKTTLALNFADSALMAGKKVLFFTNEMSAEQLSEKHLSMRAKVRGPALYRGSITDDELNRVGAAIHQVYNLPFFIDEDHGRSLVGFHNQVKKHKRKHNIDLVILDYIQQMHADDGTYRDRLTELTRISNSIKELAMEIKTPIICLAQLNRNAEKSDDIPSISQIRDCGAIEQDADNVILIHRDRNEQPNANGEVTGQLIVGKARLGKTGACPIMINFALNKFR